MKYIKGNDVIIYFKINSNWLPIGCEKTNALNEDIETRETTTRDNGEWRTHKLNHQGYTLNITALTVRDFDGSGPVVPPQEAKASYEKIVKMKRDIETIEWRRDIEYPNGDIVRQSGEASITSVGSPAAAEGFISFNISMIGQGKINSTKILAE